MTRTLLSLHIQCDSLATFPHKCRSVVIHTPESEPSSLAVLKVLDLCALL